jgi:hypothetical protein
MGLLGSRISITLYLDEASTARAYEAMTVAGSDYWTMTMGARQKANFWPCGSSTLT